MFCEATVIIAVASTSNDEDDDNERQQHELVVTPHLPRFRLEGGDEEVTSAVRLRVVMLPTDKDYTLSIQCQASSYPSIICV